jgi:TDG/mug DNA glycosylase family protein
MVSALTGYQQRTQWMGHPEITLADLWPEQPRAMIVGLFSAPVSVEAGHYYQGGYGQRQLRRLADAGLFAAPQSGTHFDEAALRAGIGFIDIVKRPTCHERHITAEEMAHGSAVLTRQLAGHSIDLVICAFRHPVTVLLGSPGAPGLQPERTSWGAQVFRMPGPTAKSADATAAMATLPWPPPAHRR